MNGKTLCLIIGALVSGIIVGTETLSPYWFAVLPVCLALSLYLVSIIRSSRNPFANLSLINTTVAFLVFWGIGLYSGSMGRPSVSNFEKTSYFYQGIVEDFTPTNTGDRVVVNLSRLSPVKGNAPLKSTDIKNVKAQITLQDAIPLNYCTEIAGIAQLQPSDAPSNYLNEDYVLFLKRKGILLTGFSETGHTKLLGQPSSASSSFNSFFRSLRYDLEAKMESASLQESTRSFLISILLGDKSYLSREERFNFTDAGVAHIFAVSGLHVSLIAAGLIAIFGLVFSGRLRNLKYFAALPLIWGYIFLVGATPATCRAGIMITITLTALILQRKYSPIKALGWAVILILSFLPNSLYDIGFQLSVVSVGSLILFVSPLNFVSHRSHPYLYKFVSLMLVTLVATFSTWLICAFYFHRFSLMFLPLNLIMVPLIPILLILSFIFFIFSATGLNPALLGKTIDMLYSFFHSCASFFNSFSSPVENFYPHVVSLFLWIAGLILLGIIINRPRPLKNSWIPFSVFSLSILTLFFLTPTHPEGFILQKNSSQTKFMSYHQGFENEITMPDKGTCSTVINGKNIIVLRNDSLYPHMLDAVKSADFIVFGKGCKNCPDNFESVISPGARIITHPSLHWRHEKNILSELKRLNIPVHSLRYDGPFHFFQSMEENP